MRRLSYAPLFVLVGIAGPAVSADPPNYVKPPVFRLSPALVLGANLEDKDAPGNATPDVRPNATTALHVYAQNPTENDGTFVTELRREAKGEVIARSAPVKIGKGKWQRVLLAKPPAPPAPPPAAPPAVAPGTPPVEPPPPGVQFPRGSDGFPFELWLLDANGAEVKVKDAVAAAPVKVTFTPVADYLTADKPEFDSADGELTWTVKATEKLADPLALKLSFGGTPPAVQNAVLARTLAPGGSATFTARIPAAESLTLQLAAGGVERVLVYDGTLSGGTLQVNKTEDRQVRVVAGRPGTDPFPTKPLAAFPVKVETDNGKNGDRLELRIRRDDDSDAARGEVIVLGGPRDEKLWVNPSDAGLELTARSTDWAKALDLSAVRGSVLVEAVLTPPAMDPKPTPVPSSRTLVVDADAPVVSGVTVGDPAKPREKAGKGNVVPVRATIKDAGGSGLSKVTFALFGKFQDDGSIPPDAIKVEGKPEPKVRREAGEPGVITQDWTADLTLPADKKGRFLIAAVAADNADNPSKVDKQDPSVKVIVLEAPPPPPGTPGGEPLVPKPGAISGVITFGGRPQPGLTVALGGADGKQKLVTTTNDKGKFCMENLPPGQYAVVTLKTNSDKGFTGGADVAVEADKTSKVAIELTRVK